MSAKKKSASPKWHLAKQVLPPVNVKFGDSDYLLCMEEHIACVPFVGWYNENLNVWYVAHHSAPNFPVSVTHWAKLVKLPTAIIV